MPILLALFFTSFMTLAIVHIFSIQFFLYWKYLWLDIPIHMLGGITVALGVAILPFIHIHIFEALPRFRTTMLFVLGVGIAWELFELFAGLSLQEPGFVSDTILDLVMDLIGGAVGYGIVQSVQAVSTDPDTKR